MSGIAVPDRILIVSRSKSTYMNTNIPQGFVVNPNSPDQYKSAIKWATETDFDKITNYNTEIEPTEFLTYNEGFKVTLVSAADQSSQGGKLSFWNCLVEKENKKFIIGIGQDSLLSAMMQSTLEKGVFKEEFKLGKSGALAHILHEQMHEWSEAELEGDTTTKKPKTTKWQIGNNYKLATVNNLYLGSIYDWLGVTDDIITVRSHIGYNTKKYRYHYKILDKPVKKIIAPYISEGWGTLQMISDYNVPIKTVSDIFRMYATQLDFVTHENEAVPFFKTVFTNILTKFNPRELGELHFGTDGTELDELVRLMEKVRQFRREKLLSISDYYLDIHNIGYSALENQKPEFTEDEKIAITLKIDKHSDIDFGDGIIMQGRMDSRI